MSNRSQPRKKTYSSHPDELGAEAAKKFNGLFSEKDWKCKLCSNINWARRDTCNQCNSPKPGSGTDAQREGYGGGFMDREPEVKYRESRYKSDDEYDDFGRLKKKKRRGTAASVSSSTSQHKDDRDEGKEKEEENEKRDVKGDSNEEEDDDGDDDGKWDAWADILGDDGKVKNKDNGKDREKERNHERDRDYGRASRSRSRSPDRERERERDRNRSSRGYTRDDGYRSRSPGWRDKGRDYDRDGRRARDHGHRRRSRSRSGERERGRYGRR